MAPDNDNQSTADAEQAFLRQLRQTFDRMPKEIPLFLFIGRGQDDVFVQACRQIVRAFRELTSKISIKEYYLDHDLAAKWGVDSSPTLLIDPENYKIRWVGAPMGEEGRSFLEAMILIGMGKSGMSEQSLTVVQKIDTPRQLKVFVSPTCPYCPQQVVNGLRAAIERPDMVSLEIVDIQCRPDLADQYGAHSVPQAFANDVLIGQGAQQEEVFMSSLLKLEPQTIFIPESTAELVEVDLLIVGGGPAGLTAGIYAERSGLKTAIVEKDSLGGQVALTPVVENYPGFTQVGGKTLVDIMVSHALQYVNIFQGEQVLDIKSGEPIEVKTSRRKFLAKSVLLATGAKHRNLGVPGEQQFSGRGVSYCATCDGPLFKGRKVIMVGGGNSAVTEALHLHNMGVSVTLVHRRDKLRAQDVLSQQLENNHIPILWNTQIKEIKGNERVEKVVLFNNQAQTVEEADFDGVFIAIGYQPAVDLAQKIGVELNGEGYIDHDHAHRTNIPGIYSAGDVEGGYKQIVTATGQGAAAAMTIFEDMINPYWKRLNRDAIKG
ncbi:MAG: thioredoxin-disulfide reductase [Desulfobacteraceae bacterium]